MNSHLSLSSASSLAVMLIFPFTPLAGIFGFRPLPILYLGALGGIVVVYILAAEVVKKTFYKRVRF